MEVIAKTESGFIISATISEVKEVKEILRSVSGIAPDEVSIGQKIPAIDYAGTITKIKSLPKNYYYQQILKSHDGLTEEIESIRLAIESASEI